jgi:hypothetical protein
MKAAVGENWLFQAGAYNTFEAGNPSANYLPVIK